MGVHYSAYTISDGFDVATITRQNVRFAFVVRLPFRLRVGGFYRHHFTFRDRHFEIVLQNRIALPDEIPSHEVLSAVKQHDKLWTEVVIVVKNPRIDEDALDRLRKWKPDHDEELPNEASESVFEAMGALNHFIVAYATTTNQMFGGRALRSIRTYDFFDYLRWEVTILGPAEEELSDEKFKELIDLRPDREITSFDTFTGELHDLPAEEIVGIDKTLSRQNEFIHFEFAFEAKSKKLAGDHVGALLMAVVALEAAHAAFVQQELGSRLLNSDDKNLPTEFLRELGIFLCNQLTPYLLMDETERPSSELIKKCGFGITIRNEIMHAKKKKGQYQLRKRTWRNISDGYSAVLGVYSCYVTALEKRIEASRGNET